MITGESSRPFSDFCIDPPTTREIKEAINKQNRNKADFVDNIPLELYLEGGNAVTRNVTQLLQSIWAGELKTAVILLFKKGDKTNFELHRYLPSFECV